MKDNIKQITIDLLSTNNFRKLYPIKDKIIELLNSGEEFLKSFIPIIEEDYDKILERLNDNEDANIEKEKLRIVITLSVVINLL